jgi:FkbM family methyltransferase
MDRARVGGWYGVCYSAAFRLKLRVDPLNVALWTIARRPRFTILQIGAYIGDTANDPLHRFIRHDVVPFAASRGRRAILVEPVKEYFQKLQELYRGCESVALENVAIAETNEPRTIYRLSVDPEAFGFPAWLSQLSSLKEERMGALWDRFESNAEYQAFYLKHRTTETVECSTLSALLSRHGVESLDLMQIDAEGYDYEIIKSIDFSKVRPRFINYESTLLGPNHAACRALLLGQRYRLLDHGADTLAILR